MTAPETKGDSAAHLAVMRLLSGAPASSQRELSRRLGWSVGKTNYLVHALLEKGLVKAQNFRHSDNKAAYAYLLTPKGVKRKMQLMKNFLGRKELEFELLQQEIQSLRAEIGKETPAR